jgi:hypothetical protein
MIAQWPKQVVWGNAPFRGALPHCPLRLTNTIAPLHNSVGTGVWRRGTAVTLQVTPRTGTHIGRQPPVSFG